MRLRRVQDAAKVSGMTVGHLHVWLNRGRIERYGYEVYRGKRHVLVDLDEIAAAAVEMKERRRD